MGNLVCKIKQSKGTRTDKIKMIKSTEDDLYSSISGLTEIEYNPHYKLEDQEIFVINDASEYITNEYILKDFSLTGTEYSEINTNEWSNLDFLIYSKDDFNYYQRIVGKKYLDNELILKFFNGKPQITENIKGITINPKSFIVYNRQEDKLYFKNFSEIKNIFNGIENIYKEATDQEIQEFLNIPLVVAAENSIDISKITSSKRIKILLALNKFKKHENIDNLIEYANKYHPDSFEENRILIDSLEKIDIFIDVIHEKYYTAEVSGERRKANSTRLLK